MRNLHTKLLIITWLCMGITACSGVNVEDYRDNTPTLSPEQFFDGSLTAHGVVKNRSGKVIRYFNASIEASWQEDMGTRNEVFLFDEGERQTRVWTLKPTGSASYAATAGDVVGVGTASYAGNSMFLNYVLQVPYNDSTIDLHIDDRMYLVNETTLINESIMSKFGFRVGSILLVIKK